MNRSKFTPVIIIALFLVMWILPGIISDIPGSTSVQSCAYAAEEPDDDPPEDDDIDDVKGKEPRKKSPLKYLPADPEVKKLKLQAMELAEKFTEILAERTALQPELAKLELSEANLKHLRLKYRLKYLKLRENLLERYPRNPAIMKLLVKQDEQMEHIEDLIVREEKIDCYHTIFERKHRAMEEYHWSLIDNKHSLIGEYLIDLDVKKHKDQFIRLYNETITDYKRIIEENKIILKETKEIIEAKKKREALMKQVVDELKGLCDELEKVK